MHILEILEEAVLIILFFVPQAILNIKKFRKNSAKC